MNSKAPRCVVCNRGFWTTRMLQTHWDTHHSVEVVREQVLDGARNDWRMPDNSDETNADLPLHNDFMTSKKFASHPSFTWRAQFTAILASKGYRAYDENSPYGE